MTHLFKKMFRLSLCTLSLFLALQQKQAFAKPTITFQLHANKTIFQVKERLQIHLKIGLERAWYNRLTYPKNKYFRLRKRRTKRAKETVFVGGKVNVRHIWYITLEYQAKKTGFFTFSPAILRVKRQTYKTQSLKIEVRKSTSAQPKATKQLPAYIRAKGDVFLLSAVSPKRIFMGQQATVSYFLFRRIDAQVDHPRLPHLPQFWIRTLVPIHPLGDWKTRYIQGKRYSYTLALQHALFPLKTGKLPVSGLSFRMRRSFADTANDAKWLTSPTTYINVRPLPQKGRPKRFHTSHVGRLQLHIKLLSTHHQAKEPFSLVLRLEGIGNIKQMDMPTLPQKKGLSITLAHSKTNTFKKETLLRGSKETTYTVLAAKAGSYTIPPIKMTYFDPWQQQYTTTQTKPLVLHVKPATQTNQVASLLGKQTTNPPLNSPKQALHPMTRQQEDKKKPMAYWWLSLLPLGLLGIALHRKRKEIREEIKEIEKREEKEDFGDYQTTKQQLQQLLSQTPDTQQIEQRLHQLLPTLLQERTHGLSHAQLTQMLSKKQYTKALIDALHDLLKSCEENRFSPLQTTVQLTEKLERFLRHLPPSV